MSEDGIDQTETRKTKPQSVLSLAESQLAKALKDRKEPNPYGKAIQGMQVPQLYSLVEAINLQNQRQSLTDGLKIKLNALKEEALGKITDYQEVDKLMGRTPYPQRN